MIWLGLAGIGLIAKLSREEKKRTILWLAGSIIFHGSLAAWLWTAAGERAFHGSETGLMGWFIIGSALFFIGELLPVLGENVEIVALAATGLGAGSFALGFDLLRPDDYSYVPGAILGVLVLIVAVQAFLKFKSQVEKNQVVLLALYIFLITIMVYAATAKMIDRGWALPWAYLASGGAMLFAAGQVRMGWGETLKRMGWGETLKRMVPVSWQRTAILNIGQLMMVAASFFVYREFL